MRDGRALGGSAEATIAAGERRAGEGGDLLSGLVGPHRLADQDRALVLALVEGPDGPGAGGEGSARRQWPVKFDLLLAVDDHQIVELAPPMARRLERHRCSVRG